MLVYILICLSLSLAGVAGLQFFYMMYLDRINKARHNHLRELEKHCKNLTIRLQKAEQKIAEQNSSLASIYESEEETQEEVWADLIEEG